MFRKFGIALVIVFALLGLYSAVGVISQAREDYSNFGKIVQWVAIKQQQDEAAARQRAAMAQQAPAMMAAPAPAPAPAK